jgi:5'-AMP-activated protein kinase, catalytic alpha subunit
LNYTKVTEYQLGSLLGQGNYAQVKQAVHKATGHQVAIKIYDKFKL